MSDVNMKGISRIVNAYTVRLYRNNKAITTTFSDSVYEGQEHALEAAILFRDRTQASIPLTAKKSNIKSDGLPKGVTKTHTEGNTGNRLPCFLVTWGFPKRHKEVFKYQEGDDRSEADAREAAITLRQRVDGGRNG